MTLWVVNCDVKVFGMNVPMLFISVLLQSVLIDHWARRVGHRVPISIDMGCFLHRWDDNKWCYDTRTFSDSFKCILLTPTVKCKHLFKNCIEGKQWTNSSLSTTTNCRKARKFKWLRKHLGPRPGSYCTAEDLFPGHKTTPLEDVYS